MLRRSRPPGEARTRRQARIRGESASFMSLGPESGGSCALSITSTSTQPSCDCSCNPSCSCTTVKIVGKTAWSIRIGRSRRRRRRTELGREIEIAVEVAGETGSIDDVAANHRLKQPGDSFHRHSAEHQVGAGPSASPKKPHGGSARVRDHLAGRRCRRLHSS